MTVTVSAHEANASGALSYQVGYGDGTVDQAAAPLFCRSPSAPESQTWSLSHSYTAAGSFTVSATVTANCTSGRATASLAVGVS
jgi:hypothetical protein